MMILSQLTDTSNTESLYLMQTVIASVFNHMDNEEIETRGPICGPFY